MQVVDADAAQLGNHELENPVIDRQNYYNSDELASSCSKFRKPHFEITRFKN